MSNRILQLDVAHPPRHPDAVESELLRTLRELQNLPSPAVVKIVHGYGSTARGGSTRETVRNWLFRQRRRLRAVIEGERYSLLDPETVQLRDATGAVPDPDLGAGNRGVTIVWVK
jgi:hypothetical protein